MTISGEGNQEETMGLPFELPAVSPGGVERVFASAASYRAHQRCLKDTKASLVNRLVPRLGSELEEIVRQLNALDSEISRIDTIVVVMGNVLGAVMPDNSNPNYWQERISTTAGRMYEETLATQAIEGPEDNK